MAREEEIKALASDTIAAQWLSSKYYAPFGGNDHPERDKKIYAVRGNWAMQKGLMQAGPDGYTDEITAPCEETGCQCHYMFLYHLRELPKAMLTERGLVELQKFDAICAEMKKTHGEPKITLGPARRSKDIS